MVGSTAAGSFAGGSYPGWQLAGACEGVVGIGAAESSFGWSKRIFVLDGEGRSSSFGRVVGVAFGKFSSFPTGGTGWGRMEIEPYGRSNCTWRPC